MARRSQVMYRSIHEQSSLEKTEAQPPAPLRPLPEKADCNCWSPSPHIQRPARKSNHPNCPPYSSSRSPYHPSDRQVPCTSPRQRVASDPSLRTKPSQERQLPYVLEQYSSLATMQLRRQGRWPSRNDRR